MYQTEQECILAIQQHKSFKNPDFNLFRDNSTVGLFLIQHHYTSFKYLGDTLKNDAHFINKAVQLNGLVLAQLPSQFSNDPLIAMKAVQSSAEAVAFLPKKLKEDLPIILAALRTSGRCISFLSKSMKDNPEVVLEALKTNPDAYFYASTKIQHLLKGQNVASMMYTLENIILKERQHDQLRQQGVGVQLSDVELRDAIRKNEILKVESHILAGGDLLSDNENALYTACFYGHGSIAKLLIQNGCSIDKGIQWATEYQQPKLLKALQSMPLTPKRKSSCP